jgi:MFS family permease
LSPTNKELAAAEWKAHWPLVLAGAFGFAMSTTVSQSIGLFMEPIGAELGWSRAQISAGLAISGASAVILSPIGGAVVDRIGSRRMAIPAIILTQLVVAAFGLVHTFPQWIFLWATYALVSVGVRLTIWTTAASKAFVHGRGLAVATVISGTALAGVLAPPIAHLLIENLGWRHAYVAQALGWGSIALLFAVLFLREPRDPLAERRAIAVGTATAPPALPGLTIPEAVRSVPLWLIGASTLIFLLFSGSIVIHQVPILVDAGVPKGEAAFLASLSAVAGFGGKLVTGWLMDRFHAARLSGITLAASSIGFALLLEPLRSPFTIVIGMIIIGYAGGAKLQVTTYLTGRYGGVRNFGKIFGVMNSLIAVGGACGPVLAGAIYDANHSYAWFLMGAIPGALIAGALVFNLGPYPVWRIEEEFPQPAPSPAAA